MRLLRISFVGELGYELHIPADQLVDVYNALSDAGQEYGIQNAGYRAFYSLSCEKGYHLWEQDLRSDDTPVEANLGFVCRRSGEYKGKSVIDAQRTSGIRKRLVYMTLDEQVPLWGLESVFRNGEPVGHVRRADYGYTIKKSIGKSFIRRPDGQPIDADFIKSGKYEIEIMGKRYNAQCHIKSPFDPDNLRIFGKY